MIPISDSLSYDTEIFCNSLDREKQIVDTLSQEQSHKSRENMSQNEWTCKKCTAVNQPMSLSCWNCRITFQQSEDLRTGVLGKKQLDQEEKDRAVEVEKNIASIPVVSIDPISILPIGKFKIKGIVSAQVIKSTGFLLGISGMEGALGSIGLDLSSVKNTTAGEAEVMNILRVRAYAVGANAVIGVDLDISDAGGFKTVLICAQGTAIFIDDIEQYFEIK